MAKKQPSVITQHEAKQVKRANAAGTMPVVFVHGLWLLPSSWDRWAKLFEKNGYTALSPGWPDDPDTVEEAKAHPEVFAHKSIGQVADHFQEIIGGLDRKPAIIGHSFGGLRPRSWRGAAWRRCRWRSTRPRSAGCCRCRSRR
jgi:non-heme chloroperoxidase